METTVKTVQLSVNLLKYSISQKHSIQAIVTPLPMQNLEKSS